MCYVSGIKFQGGIKFYFIELVSQAIRHELRQKNSSAGLN